MPTRPTERLHASPAFALAFALDGRPYVAKETEPYVQFWLTERERVLLSFFSSRAGSAIGDAIEAYYRLTRAKRSAAEEKRILKVIGAMRRGGVLAVAGQDVSRYNAGIVDAYLEHRPFPGDIAMHILKEAAIGRDSRVLDLAGGPGDLALQLAAVSTRVSLMDLSSGFLAAARSRARRLGLPLATVHESANRLVFNDDEYDVVTISQALHWLDDILVCRGICRVLARGGSFFVVHGAMDIADDHPLGFLLGRRSILGHKAPGTFASEVQVLLDRLGLLFQALDARDVHRVGDAPPEATRIVPAGATLFRQRRPIGVGFARAFLTPQHIAGTGLSPELFWKDVESRCANAAPGRLEGALDWAVLHFRRGGPGDKLPSLSAKHATEIGFRPASIG
jgi:SAM-dependent methyltransferase